VRVFPLQLLRWDVEGHGNPLELVGLSFHLAVFNR